MRSGIRFVTVAFTSAATLYILSILPFVLFSFVRGEDPWEGGFLMAISPLAILFFLMTIPAAVFGVVSGSVISATWRYSTRSRINILKISGSIAFGFGVLWAGLVALDAAQSPSIDTYFWMRLAFSIFVCIICLVANLISISITKPIFRNAA